jgi:hypothetical protein
VVPIAESTETADGGTPAFGWSGALRLGEVKLGGFGEHQEQVLRLYALRSVPVVHPVRKQCIEDDLAISGGELARSFAICRRVVN